MNDLVNEVKNKMDKAYEVLRSDLATVRSGKANSSMVENIEVNAYGGSARLKVMELATINVTDPKTIVISPFDMSVIGEIEKAISESGIGINPVVSESVIRLSVPPLNQERREEMVKMINQKSENGKVMIRQIRQEGMHEVKKLKDKGHTSEDDLGRSEEEIQKLTDQYIKQIDEMRENKEKELMTV